jgi:large subunit ribosomal protein L14e
MFETGRICMKTAGREAGRFCVVVGKEKGEEKEFVIVTGPRIVTKVRRRKCNVHHLEPTPIKIGIKENATDNEIMKAFEKNDVYKKLNLHKPTPEEIKLTEEAKERHKAKPKEEKREEKKEEKKKEPEKKPEKKKEEKPKREHKKEKKHRKPKHKKEKKAKPKKEKKHKKASKKKSKKGKKK